MPQGRVDPNNDPLPIMLQRLFADRFQLRLHRETRALPVYELLQAKGGAKIQSVPEPERSASGALPPPLTPGAAPPPGAFLTNSGQMTGTAVPLARLIRSLSQQLGRTVVDKTGFTGFFNIKLQWTPDSSQGPDGIQPSPTPDSNAPSIFTAIQEQLGLRLESAKGPVEVLVIDSVQRPSDN